MLKAANSLGEEKFAWQPISLTEDYYCVGCKEKVIFVDAVTRIKHFRHYPISICEYRSLLEQGETERHVEMKATLAQMFNLKPENMEVHLKSKGCNRIADLFIEPDKIIECQATPIGPKALLERTKDYTKADLYVWWIFDSSIPIAPRLNRLLKQMYFGRYYQMDEKDLCSCYKHADYKLTRLPFLYTKEVTPYCLNGEIKLKVIKPNDKFMKEEGENNERNYV